MTIPKRVRDRFKFGLKKLVPILTQQCTRDVSEADTVTLVKDLLNHVLGFDKYSEVTGEYQIRGRFCDLAIKLDGKVTHLIEVKAIGVTLAERHLRQALGYAANEGIEWMILTNGIVWRLYNVVFGKPIEKHLVVGLDLQHLDVTNDAEARRLFVFSKEGYQRGAHEAMQARQAALSRHRLAAVLLHNRGVQMAIRRELRRMQKVQIQPKEIRHVLRNEVIKRDILESPDYQEAMALVKGTQAARPTAAKPATRVDRRPQTPSAARARRAVQLDQLITAGVLTAPTTLFRRYKGERVEAEMRADGTIAWNGTTYDSPSTAAAAVRSSVLGRPATANGWNFWRYKDAEGQRRPLADAREMYLDRPES